MRAHQPQPRIVYERRRLQRLARAFALQIAARHAAKLVVDERQQLIVRVAVAFTGRGDQPRDGIRVGRFPVSRVSHDARHLPPSATDRQQAL